MELKPGEIICDECLGTGESIAYHLCPKCHGSGKLDWVEAVVGKKPKADIFNGVTWMAPDKSHPSSPQIGQAYINTNNDKTYVYDGKSWVEIINCQSVG